MTCCSSISTQLRSHRDIETFKAMESLHCFESLWLHLLRCPRCGQLWLASEWDKFAAMVAVKVDEMPTEEKAKQAFDRAHEALTIEEYGGLSEEECTWKGCQKKALKGTRICFRHLGR